MAAIASKAARCEKEAVAGTRPRRSSGVAAPRPACRKGPLIAFKVDRGHHHRRSHGGLRLYADPSKRSSEKRAETPERQIPTLVAAYNQGQRLPRTKRPGAQEARESHGELVRPSATGSGNGLAGSLVPGGVRQGTERNRWLKQAGSKRLGTNLRSALVASAHIHGVQHVPRLVRGLWLLRRRRFRRRFWQNIILRRRRNDDHRIVELRTSWKWRAEREQRSSAGNSKGLGLHGRDPYRRLKRRE